MFFHFCCKPCKIKFCIEEVSVGEIYNTLLDSNEGDPIPHISHTIYFPKQMKTRYLETNLRDNGAEEGCYRIIHHVYWNVLIDWEIQWPPWNGPEYYSDVIMSAMASRLFAQSFVYAHQRIDQSSASLAFVREPTTPVTVDSPYKGLVTRKYFHLMTSLWCTSTYILPYTLSYMKSCYTSMWYIRQC